ncbi:MAG: patatin-like phospholipase family protein [Vibrio sp.]|uniref:patatin-like phospholipase family protein n=1 Tax=Vibrio sp. TaxID=678 RepID=UPI003A89E156
MASEADTQSNAIQVEQPQTKRPKIAVVLAGGGAKGAAHVGVLKALEEMHIPVDFITGTSMGAYVGGLYATGMSASEIENLIYSVDWNTGYRDRVSRSQRLVRDKEYEDRYQLTTDLGIHWGEIRAPKGVVQGQNMLRILRVTSGNLAPFKSFNQLAIPYRAVATDIVELKPVALEKGYLVDAMMASMSVPGALPPYEVDGHLLVDGGVTNNMPVDVARAMGADIVIAVDISTDYKEQDDFTNYLTVADQLSNYMVRRSTQEQATTLKEGDVFLQPEVGHMETTEFDRMPEAYDKGYQAAMMHQSELGKLSLSSSDYQQYVDEKEDRRRVLQYGDNVVVDNIVINNDSHYSELLLQNRLHLDEGRKLTTEEIEQRVEDLYALDRFELVRYKYQQNEAEENELVVDVREKSWGPNYANFRFFLEDDFTTDSQYSIGVSTNFTDLDSNGTGLMINIDGGTDKLLEAELYSPLFSTQKAFTTLSGRYTNDKRNVPLTGFDNTDLEASKNYVPVSYAEWIAEAALGYQYALWSEAKIGLRYTDGIAELSNLPDAGDVSFQRQGLFLNYRVDTLDSFSLPTKGIYFDFEYLISHDDAYTHGSSAEDGSSMADSSLMADSGEDTVYELTTKIVAAQSYKRHTLVGNAEYGVVTSKNSLTPIDPKTIGGFLNLSGIPRNSLIGQNKAFTSLVYRYRWFDNDFGLFTSPVYLGASIEYGGVWSDPDLRLKSAPLYAAASVFAGVDSPIGPIVFGYGRTEQNFDSLYLILGTTFK